MTTPPPMIRPRRLRQRRPRVAAGFTLIELLLGVTLGALLVGSLGGALLVSELRLSNSIRTDSDRRDALNRVVALIRSEISGATRLTTVTFGNASNICVSTSTLQSLQLSTPGVSQNICYRAVTRSSSIVSNSYSATDRPWTGNCLLMRFGPPYDPSTGEIGQGTRLGQVLLDDLVSNSAGNCTAASFSFALTTSAASEGTVNGGSRDVDVTITQSNGQVTQFSARSGSNPLYSGNDWTSYLSSQVPTVCDANGARHIRLDLTTIPTLDRQCRNILYLANRYDSYQPPPVCSNGVCTINGSTINNVDVLVFADRELRP